MHVYEVFRNPKRAMHRSSRLKVWNEMVYASEYEDVDGACLSFIFSSCSLRFQDDTGGSHKSLSNSVDSQLKYENDRLKKALAQRYVLLLILYISFIIHR